MFRHVAGFVLVAALAGGSGVRAQGGAEFQIIVNLENPIVELDRASLREAFLKKSTAWARGGAIRPIDLAKKFPQRERFTRDVVKKTPAQLKSYWNQQIFSGKGVPPPEADTASAVISYVLAHKGAVGYLPANVEARGVKVVKVK